MRRPDTLSPAVMGLLALLATAACDDARKHYASLGGGGGDTAAPDTGPAPDTGEDAAAALPDVADTGADDVPEASDAADASADVPFVPWPGTEPDQALAWTWLDPNEVAQADPDMVRLPHVSDPEGRMTGAYAKVDNCINREGGVSTTIDYQGVPIEVCLCVVEQTVLPDPDGNYLSVQLPDDLKDPDDPFAEVQMYFHMNRIHDYFSENHGHEGMDRPLRAVVNLQVGITMRGTGWLSIDNAAYVPKESLDQLGRSIGVKPPIDEDAIIFAQGPKADMAYDGDVVYHEYTHATIGSERLVGPRADRFGADMGPLSLNEAHADYFAGTLTDDSLMAGWALGQLGAARDLTEHRSCPDDLIGESHHDGQIFSSALWEIRESLGTRRADAIIFDAVMAAGPETGFEEATEAVIAQAATLEPPRDAAVRRIFEDHGLPACPRVRDLDASPDGAFHYVPGTQGTGVTGFADGAPGYVQFSFSADEDTQWARLTLERTSGGMEQYLEMLGGSPGDLELELALKQGGDAIEWTYDEDGAWSDADDILPVARDGDRYEVAFAGRCLLPGRHVLQLVATSGGGGGLNDLAVELSADPPPEDLELERYHCDLRP